MLRLHYIKNAKWPAENLLTRSPACWPFSKRELQTFVIVISRVFRIFWRPPPPVTLWPRVLPLMAQVEDCEKIRKIVWNLHTATFFFKSSTRISNGHTRLVVTLGGLQLRKVPKIINFDWELQNLSNLTYIGYFCSSFFGTNIVSCDRASKTESM